MGTPPNGVVECRWVDRNRDSEPIISGFTACCEPLNFFSAASAIHLAATDHSEFITLVAGKRSSLLMAGNNDEVYV